MKKFIKVVYIILLIVLIKFLITFAINEVYIKNYESGEYKEGLVKSLTILNFSESYVAHYNYGNYYYQKGKYSEAIKQYNQALEANPPKDKECSIRINKALCILQSVDLDEKTAEENIEILYEAREVLCEKGCANTDDDNGHSETAEELKKDIDELIDELKNPDEDEEDDDKKDDEKDKQDDEDENDEEEQKEKEEELKERQKEAANERKEGEENNKSLDNYTYSNYGDKNW